MTLRQRIRFYQQLSVLIRAGVTIRASLTRLKDRIPTSETAVLNEKLNAGERIGDAFAAAGFSPFECNLITAGEQSGHLDNIFQHLSEFWSRELQMQQALMRPLYYPFAVMHLAIVVGCLLEISTTPLWEIGIHVVIRLAIFYAACFVIYTLVRVSWANEGFRRFWLYVPFVGGALRATYAYRWITALRLEFGAGILISRAVGDAWRASGYIGCDQHAEEAEKAMREGANLSALVTQWKQLPRDWIDFIETGEISGGFEEAFQKLEKESADAWKAAHDRMAEWIPKIAYFVVLLIIAAQIILMYKSYYDSMFNQVDKALNGN